MPFKINISDKGKTYKLEIEDESLIGKKIGDKIDGKEIKPDLEGYELKITGTSDKAGFPGFENLEGQGLRKVLLKYGKGMKQTRPKGLRKRKAVRGNLISANTVQINMKVEKTGEKKLEDIFGKKEEPKPEEKTEEKFEVDNKKKSTENGDE